MKRFVCLSGALLGLAGCAGNPSLPSRVIDQPYALPGDTRLFSLGLGANALRRSEGENSEAVLLPLGRIEVPISDRWTWMALTMVRTELSRNDRNTWGLRFGMLEVGWSSLQGWLLEPHAELYYRRVLGPDFALENRLGGSYATRSKRGDYDGNHVYYTATPIWQLSENKSVSLGATVVVDSHYAPASIDQSDYLPYRASRTYFPLRAGFEWRWSQGWESNLDYTYRGLGVGNGYRSHLFALEIVRYW